MKKRRLNLPLLEVFIASVVLHVLGLIALGGWVVYRYVNDDATEFEAPPLSEQIAPKKLQRMVQLQQEQKRSSRPTQRISVSEVTQMDMSNLDIALPQLDLAGEISSADYGAGAGVGSFGSGGIELSMPEVEFIGIKARGERFFFVVDASDEPLTDEFGGIPAYNLIKDELVREIEKLPPGVLFNVVFYRNTALQILEPTGMLPATVENKERLKQWIAPINATFENRGIQSNVEPARRDYDENFRPEEIERWLAGLVLAGEQGADTVFMVAHGSHKNWRNFLKDRTLDEELQKVRDEFAKSGKLAEWEEAMRKTRAAIDRENKARAKKGIPKKVVTNWWRETRDRFPDVEPPPTAKHEWYTQDEITDVLKKSFEINYADRDYDPPSINVIQLWPQERFDSQRDFEEDTLKVLTRRFYGRYKALPGLKGIQDVTGA